MTKLALIFGCILLGGCTIEPDSWYCSQNGFTPGTELYAQCLDNHEQARLQASANLLQFGAQEEQVPYVQPPQPP
jgi:hypothetical protein